MKSLIYCCALFLSFFLSACNVNHFIRMEPELYTVDERLNVENDSTILALIAPYKAKLADEMNQVIGTAAMDLDFKKKPESLLGNFIADALQTKAEEYIQTTIDFAIVNSDGLRVSSIPKGPIRQSLIFELLPFENILVILEIDGKLVRSLVDLMADNGGWPVSQGLYYQITQSGATEIRIKGIPLEEGQLYKVALPAYIANGGGDASFLTNLPQQSTQKLLRTAIIEYIRESPYPISARMDGRIEIKN